MATDISVFDVRANGSRQSGSGVTIMGRSIFNRADYAPELQGQAGILKYERMRRDPEIASALMRRKAPLLAANWTFEPPETGTKKIIDEMMDLCNRYILGEGRSDVRDTWKGGLLPQILLQFDFGVSAVEKVWGIDERGRQVYRRLCPIGPQTINEFELDELGNVAVLIQYAYVQDENGVGHFRRQLIPDAAVDPGATAADKLAVFTYRQEGDNHFGRPILRELYQAWYHKYELWLLDAIQKEVHGMGSTIVQIPETITDMNSPQYLAALEFVKNFRSNDHQGGVIGDGWTVTRSFPTGTPPDILGSQQYCDTQMARAMGVEESHLGDTPNGTRSISESKTSNLMVLAQSDADMIENQVNTQLVPILCARNVGPQEEYPKFQCEDLDKMTGTQQAEILSKAGSYIRPDDVLEEHLRENMDFPPIDYATRKESLPPEISTAPGLNGNGNGAAGRTAPALNVRKAAAPDAPPSPFWREPMAHEAHVRFADMANFLDTEPQRIWYRVVEPYRAKQITMLAQAAAAVSDSQLARGDLPRRQEPQMANDLATALEAVYIRGRRDVVDEINRQRGMAKAEDEDPVQPTKQNLAWVKLLAVGLVASQLDALVARARDAGQSARNANMPKAEVEDSVMAALKNLSVPTAQADLAGTITRVYTNGRVEQGQAMADQIESVFYTAIMDTNTCGPCFAMDGAELEMETYGSQIPNPNCEGDDRCRCEPVFIVRQAAEAA